GLASFGRRRLSVPFRLRHRRRSPGSVLILWACSTWTLLASCRSLVVARSCRSSRALRRRPLPGRRPLVVARRLSRASTLTAQTGPDRDASRAPHLACGPGGALLSHLGAADDAVNDLPMHAQLSGDQGHRHAVSVCGLHGSVTIPCSGL